MAPSLVLALPFPELIVGAVEAWLIRFSTDLKLSVSDGIVSLMEMEATVDCDKCRVKLRERGSDGEVGDFAWKSWSETVS